MPPVWPDSSCYHPSEGISPTALRLGLGLHKGACYTDIREETGTGPGARIPLHVYGIMIRRHMWINHRVIKQGLQLTFVVSLRKQEQAD